MDSNRKCEALHDLLQEAEFSEVLNRLKRDGEGLNQSITNFGSKVKHGINKKRRERYQKLINAEDAYVGLLAVAYEAENETDLEEKLSLNRVR